MALTAISLQPSGARLSYDGFELDAVWGYRFVTDSVLRSAICDLRAALQDDPKEPCYIETVSRRGYRFIVAAVGAPVRSASAVERDDAGGPCNPALAALTALCLDTASTTGE